MEESAQQAAVQLTILSSNNANNGFCIYFFAYLEQGLGLCLGISVDGLGQLLQRLLHRVTQSVLENKTRDIVEGRSQGFGHVLRYLDVLGASREKETRPPKKGSSCGKTYDISYVVRCVAVLEEHHIYCGAIHATRKQFRGEKPGTRVGCALHCCA